MDKWQQVLENYGRYSKQQIKIRQSIGEEIPLLFFEDIDLQKISSEEKKKLELLDTTSQGSILLGVNDILGRFKKIRTYRISRTDAEQKLCCKIEQYIPEQATVDLHFFSTTCSIYTDESIKTKELNWLYWKGYVPHLYFIKGEPRFYSDMWFIVDFIIREVRKKAGLGILSGFRDLDNLPKFWQMRSWLNLVHYMYYSWLIVKSVLEYADNLARSKGLKGIEFRIASQNIADKLYINEAKVLADKCLSMQDMLTLKTLKYYRDAFALYSFEAFPLSYLIHHIDTEQWRRWFLTEGQTQGLLSVANPVNINTYSQYSKSQGYSLLSAFVDGALSIHEGRKLLGVEDIIETYRRPDERSGKRPCRVCTEYFTPKRKFEITCGKPDCVKANKNRSKKASLTDKFRYF